MTADLPDRSMPKCMAELSLIAFILMRKFVEHMPFYRQIAQIERDYRWTVASSIAGNWFNQACELLEPLYQCLRQEVLKSDYLQADESPIKVLDRTSPERRIKVSNGYTIRQSKAQSFLIIEKAEVKQAQRKS